MGLDPGASLEEFVTTLTGSGSESEIAAIEPIVVNGLEARYVTQEGNFGTGYFAVVSLEEDLVLLLGGGGSNDFQGILNSIAYGPEASVVIPSFDPSEPPLGVDAPCMQELSSTGAEDLTGTLNCDSNEAGTVDSFACEVQTALLARDLEAMAGLMADPFTIGYWGSEGGWASPEDMVRELDNARLPEDTSGLTFTTCRGLFPALAGASANQLFGPDLNPALLVYSEGWGTDGLGAAILYFVEDDSGAFRWSSLAFSHKHFDR